ncbi:helix-turn-helix domain-containing protein [Halobacteriovorax marinus]|uniref:helix-turn-helix domain-containing protein n=1 Tax=Halobacteriovorax marinus TaxID=97084 RepID=UPI003A8C90A5
MHLTKKYKGFILTKKVPYSTFNTDTYNKKDKLDVYKESMGIVFDTEADKEIVSRFEAQIHSFLLSEIMLIDCTTLDQYFERSKSKIAKDGLDHILVQMFISGDTTRELQNDQFNCPRGSLIIIDTSRPWKAFNKQFRNLTLVIPRRLFKGKVPNEDLLHGLILDTQQNPFASLLHSHILSLQANITKITNDFAHSVVSPSVEMVCAAINYNPNNETSHYSPDKNVALIFRIKNYIEENLSNTELSIPLILSEFNLTKSTLYRLFPTQNGGIMRYVKERRLVRAYRSLSIKTNNKTISQISYESGFESESSFTRAFKKFFEQLPRDVQKGANQSIKFDATSPDRVWENWFRAL